MKRLLYRSLLFLLIPLSLLDCTSKSVSRKSDKDAFSGVYYWKTVFQLGEEERQFIKEHAVDRMYLRLFDVDVSETIGSDYDGIVPVATTIFKDSIPKGVEIVPTIFITVGAIKEMIGLNLSTGQLSSKILKRILNMVDYNDLGRSGNSINARKLNPKPEVKEYQSVPLFASINCNPIRHQLTGVYSCFTIQAISRFLVKGIPSLDMTTSGNT